MYVSTQYSEMSDGEKIWGWAESGKEFPIQDLMGSLKQTNTNAVSYGLS